MKRTKHFGIIFLFIAQAAYSQAPSPSVTPTEQVMSIPLELNYQYQPDLPSRKEAADPVCKLYSDGYYYLFVSKSHGYWRSPDLKDWEYIRCHTIGTIDEYAPTIMEYKGYMYYFASGKNEFYRNATPEKDTWEKVPCHFDFNQWDPYFFADDDGKVYLYWGCSDVNPIMGALVEPEDGFRVIGEPKPLIGHNAKTYGWEAFGADNEEGLEGWNEGASMLKYKGKYYLQYASPGTQFRIYADGCYVGNSPLGPFTYLKESPFAFKPGGFIGGTGHGDTFKDKYGNYWHVSSLKIGQRHWYERRIALIPITMDEKEGPRAYTAFIDYPFAIPNKDAKFDKYPYEPLYNLLSYRKQATASSCKEAHPLSAVNDEQVETWWSAISGNPGEWLQIDLGEVMTINAMQVNFADDQATVQGPNTGDAYQYIIEISQDGKTWKTVVDEKANQQEIPHKLHALAKAEQARYVKITNSRQMSANFSMYDFRIFGKGNGDKPTEVQNMKVNRNDDKRRYHITWDAVPGVTGYVVEWGTEPKQLYHSAMTFDTKLEGGYFNADCEYYFHVRAFNENGVSK